VHRLEPQAACDTLAHWREQAIKMRNDMAIFLAIKGNQQVFNGYGVQETCDMLCGALIHPCMPVYQLCVDDVLWN